MRSFSFLFLFIFLRGHALSAELPDLGHGLAYLRVQSLVTSADDLRAALLRPAPLVLDLRYPADEPSAAAILKELNSPATKPALYVLVSPATPATVADILKTTATRLVTLGIKDSRPAPQVTVAQTAAADRAAYDALAAGTTLAQLTSGKIEKERFDEATLVQEFRNGNPNAHPPAPPAAAGATTPAAPPIDSVLQRAVHLHRALQALKR